MVSVARVELHRAPYTSVDVGCDAEVEVGLWGGAVGQGWKLKGRNVHCGLRQPGAGGARPDVAAK
jgi:hypothetical protein